jgi:uncharacterized delta-60 repeat protein
MTASRIKNIGRLMACCLLYLSIIVSANAQDGSLDPSFNSSDPGFATGDGFSNAQHNSYVSVTAIQSDGKILVAGSFTTYNGTAVGNIARLNPDGSLDNSFTAGNAGYGEISSIVVRPDGKIFIAGGGFVHLLHADGTRDLSFNTGTGLNGFVNALLVQPDGKVVAVGRFRFFQNTFLASHIIRLNTDGSIDAGFVTGAGFNGDVSSIALQPDGKLLAGGLFSDFNGTVAGYLVRLNPNGSLDNSFNTAGSSTNGNVYSILLQPDGKWLIGGEFTEYNGVPRKYMVRVIADGALDNSFNPGDNFITLVGSIALQPDGKILAGGNFYNYNGLTRGNIARMLTDGSLDPGFSSLAGNGGPVKSICLQPDGNIITGGLFNYSNQRARNNIARLHTDGTPDLNFNPDGGAINTVLATAVQPDGRIILGGIFNSYNGLLCNRLARTDPSGIPEPGFGGAGPNDRVTVIALQADKKILAGGYFTAYGQINRKGIARINADGTADDTFNMNGPGTNQSVEALAVQPDGKIIIAGYFNTYNGVTRTGIARLLADGTLDNSFDPGAGSDGFVFAVAVQPDGKILVGGAFNHWNGQTAGGLARLNADGTLDNSFSTGSGTDGIVYCFALQPDGKIMAAGEFTHFNGISRNRVLRLEPGGALDPAFDPVTGPNFWVKSLLLQPDGKLLLSGYFMTVSGSSWQHLARLTPAGALDPSFDPGIGANGDAIESMALQPNGRLIIGGSFTAYNAQGRNRVARVFAFPRGGGLNFDGTDDNILVAAPASFPATAGAFTIEAWIKPASSLVKNGIAAWGTGGLVNAFRTMNSADGAGLAGGLMSDWGGSDLKVAPAGFDLFDGNWHHVACAYDDATRKIYVDGNLVGQDNPTTGPAAATVSFTAGLTNSADYFKGDIDELRIWNRGLCLAELQNNMNGELDRAGQTGLSLLFHFNQGIVGLDNSSITSAADSSGNNNTGILNNFTLSGSSSNWGPGTLTMPAALYTATSLAGDPGGDPVCRTITAQALPTSYSDTSCNAIAAIASSGAFPLLGDVEICVTVDQDLQFFNDQPYVQRHYDITPANNAATSTATVTLYYTQTDFDNYNLYRGIYPALPEYPGDTAGIAHLLVNQAHGTGTAPGNYTDTTVIINPADDKIVWNAAAQRWEVTFNVTGFSGFFIQTNTTNTALPLKLTRFSGQASGNVNVLSWVTNQEENTLSFELQRSTDGVQFTVAAKLVAAGRSTVQKLYNYTDSLAIQLQPVWYYRLKMIDLDGKFSYSQTIVIKRSSAYPAILVSPNPFIEKLQIRVASNLQENATLTLHNMSGSLIQQQMMHLQKGSNTLSMEKLDRLPSGLYLLTLTTNTRQEQCKIVKQ